MGPLNGPATSGESGGDTPDALTNMPVEGALPGAVADDPGKLLSREVGELQSQLGALDEDDLDLSGVTDSVTEDPSDLGIPPQIDKIPLYNLVYGMLALNNSLSEASSARHHNRNHLTADVLDAMHHTQELIERRPDISAVDIRRVLSQSKDFQTLLFSIWSGRNLREGQKPLPKADRDQKKKITFYLLNLDLEQAIDAYQFEIDRKKTEEEAKRNSAKPADSGMMTDSTPSEAKVAEDNNKPQPRPEPKKKETPMTTATAERTEFKSVQELPKELKRCLIEWTLDPNTKKYRPDPDAVRNADVCEIDRFRDPDTGQLNLFDGSIKLEKLKPEHRIVAVSPSGLTLVRQDGKRCVYWQLVQLANSSADNESTTNPGTGADASASS